MVFLFCLLLALTDKFWYLRIILRTVCRFCDTLSIYR